MRIISTSYSKTPGYSDPDAWLRRISFYTGILEELAKKHKIISFERIGYDGGLVQHNVRYRFILFKKNKVLFPWRMHSEIKKLRPDVVIVNGFIFPLQVIQLRWKLGGKVKIIILHRAEKPFNGWKRYLQQFADKCVNAYLFSSLEFCREWKQNITINKVHEVMHASSSFVPVCPTKAKEQTKASGYPVFLWVGRLDTNKDPLIVVKAFIKFWKQKPSAKLYMIYQSEELLNAIKDLITKEDAVTAIQLVGEMSHAQLQAWYGSADFIVSGSHYEGGGIAVAEALSCGCIPIVTDIPSFRIMTAHGNCGFLYEPGNEKELLAALLKTIDLPIEKEKMKVLEQFNNELSFKAIAAKINTIITNEG